jgi:hypothetical protein
MRAQPAEQGGELLDLGDDDRETGPGDRRGARPGLVAGPPGRYAANGHAVAVACRDLRYVKTSNGSAETMAS